MTWRAAPPPRVAAVHLLVLCSFAFAQPLFDLLGRNGEFFAARGSTQLELVAFALGLTVLPPALLLAVEALAALAGSSARAAAHVLLVGAVASVVALQVLRRVDESGWTLLALAIVIGAAAAVAYALVPPVRSVATALAPAPLLFLGLFFFHSDATTLTFTGEANAQTANVRAAAPVVLIVFDEFPLASLVDRHHQIDPVRYPHLAELARGATWFRRTTSVAEGTLHAVPAILTARYPRAGALPRFADHPQNIFTLLGRSDAMRVFESETHLCPPQLCPRSGSFGGRMRSLTSDLSVVYLHLLLPRDLASRIPSVSNGWQDFRGTTEGRDQARRFEQFLEALRPTGRPTFYFVHALLPHSPWHYLPSGRRYTIAAPPGWDTRELWTTDRASVVQYWQRHLLQVGFVDGLIGRLLARLRTAGLYDRSLVVVTADHGISFTPGGKRRPASRSNLQDVEYVPFLLKEPGQGRGRAVDRPARTIDVLPTIADVLGIRIPWGVDGRSALSSGPRLRDSVLVKDGGRRLVAPLGALMAGYEQTLTRQHALFGSDEPVEGLYGIGPYRRLLGTKVGRLDVQRNRGRVTLAPIRGSDPAEVGGRIAVGPAHDIALAADGRIAAVVPVWARRFWALVPGSASDLKVFALEGRPHAPTLRALVQG
jgi:sulfatase-like protein